MDKRRVKNAFANYALNPVVKALAASGLPPPGIAILETTGRKTGQSRRTPVGKCLQGDTFWIVAEDGRRAAYVRNMEANPRVRVKLGRRWRSGTAHPMPEDDPRERQRKMRRPLNAAAVRLVGTDLLTVRIDLDPR
jgi:deazaflavin-dependent oxidoreductase (nitroreductase family)